MANPSEIHGEMLDAWNRRDWGKMRSLFHDDYTYTGGDGKELVGPDTGVEVAISYAEALPDGKAEITNVCVSGSTVVAEFVARGTHQGDLMGVTPTGKPVEIRVCNVMEIRDGKVYREGLGNSGVTMVVRTGDQYHREPGGHFRVDDIWAHHSAGTSAQEADVSVTTQNSGETETLSETATISIARREMTRTGLQANAEAIQLGLDNSDSLGEFRLNYFVLTGDDLGESEEG